MVDMYEEIQGLYERWLMDQFPDEIHSKDDLINKAQDGYGYDEFIQELRDEIDQVETQ